MSNGEGNTELEAGQGASESQAKELQATPGYADGSMKESDPEQYAALTEKITALFNQTETTGGVTDSAALESEAKQLQATPGYVDGTLKNTNPEAYKILQEKITDLFNRSGQAEVPTLEAASQASVAKAEDAAKLMDDANMEFGALKKMGYDGKLPDDIQPYHIEGWRGQRLLEAGNYTELQPLLEQGLRDIETPDAHIAALGLFLSTDDFDPLLRGQILEKVNEFVFMAKHFKATGEIK